MRELPVLSGAPSFAYDVTAPQAVDPACGLCPLAKGPRTVCMPAELGGPTTGPTLLVVGQGPGVEEDRAGRPFVGSSGSYLRQMLQRRWPGPIAFDNAVRCAPGATELKPMMIDRCRPYGVSVRLAAKPARILAMGAYAIRSVIGESFAPMSARKGYAHLHDGTPVFFLMHPVMSLRNRFARGWFEEDLDWALKAVPDRPMERSVAFLVTTRAEAEEAVAELRLADWVTWDVETFGAPFNREFAVLNLALTPGGTTAAYVLEREALEDPLVRAPIFDLLQDKTVKKCGQNLKYDLLCMRAAYGLRSEVDFDTELVHRLFDAEAEANLATIQTKVGFAGGKQEAHDQVDLGGKELARLRRLRKRKKNPLSYDGPTGLATLVHATVDEAAPVRWSVSPEQVRQAIARLDAGDEHRRFSYAAIDPVVRSRYNAGDTISTDRLRSWLDERAQEQPHILQVWEAIGKRLTYAVTQMEWNGILIDRAKVRELQKFSGEKIAEAEATLAKYGSINWNSTKQLADFFFKQEGLTPVSFTEKGTPQLTKDTLGQLKHPAASAILQLRRATHFKSQYADGMDFFVQDDGRVHPSFKIAGTGTGRPSAEDPNVLNLPRPKSADGKLCRDVFVAPKGYRLGELDFNQQELRVAAMLSGDKAMIELFKAGVDFHLATAKMPLVAQALKVNPDDVTKEHPARDDAKIINFSVLYGKGAAQLAAERGLTVRQAQAVLDAIMGAFKRCTAWREEQVHFARKYGYCRTWWDGEPFRLRPLWHIADGDGEARGTAERSSYNTPVQGTAAEFMNATLGEAQLWLEKSRAPAKLVLTVYDSILFEMEDNKTVVDDVMGNVKRIMEGWNSLGVPLVAEMKTGEAWGSLEGFKL